jgi:hypothetical protein
LTKAAFAHASKQARHDVVQERLAWLDTQPDLNAKRLAFIVLEARLRHDETGASTNMATL